MNLKPLERNYPITICRIARSPFGAAHQRLAFSRLEGCRYPCCSQEDMVMDRFDFSPLFRSTIGFDRLTRLVDAATRVDSASLAYPPYNIEKTGEHASGDGQGGTKGGRERRRLPAPWYRPACLRAALQPR